jgi:hypothetical protein
VRAFEVARTAGARSGAADALRRQAVALRSTGRLDEALSVVREGLAQLAGTDVPASRSHLMLVLAETLLDFHQFAEAGEALRHSFDVDAAGGDPWTVAETLIVLGGLKAANGATVEARKDLDRALAIADEIGSPLLADRARRALAAMDGAEG